MSNFDIFRQNKKQEVFGQAIMSGLIITAFILFVYWAVNHWFGHNAAIVITVWMMFDMNVSNAVDRMVIKEYTTLKEENANGSDV